MSLLEWLGFKPKRRVQYARPIDVGRTYSLTSVEVAVRVFCRRRPLTPIPFTVEVNEVDCDIAITCPHCRNGPPVIFINLLGRDVFEPRVSCDDVDDTRYGNVQTWDSPSLILALPDGHSAEYIVVRDIEGKFIPNDIYQKFIS